MLRLVIGKDYIFYLPGQNNLTRFFHILHLAAKISKSKIIYPVVGGWLPEYLQSHPSIAKKLKSISAILVESQRMVNQLKSMGFKNVEILQNFRITDFKPQIAQSSSSPARFAFMARIIPEKGCDILLDAVNILNQKYGTDKFLVDFYGPIADDYKTHFTNRLQNHKNTAYKGLLQPDEVFAALSQHHFTLLPTFYEGEGYPGTIVDSFLAGTPVIVTDWKDLASFINEDKTGFVIPPKNAEKLASAMERIITQPDIIQPMRLAAIAESDKFSADKAWQTIKKHL